MSEVLAVIEAARVGARDVGSPVLWFDVKGDGWGALQVFPVSSDTATELLSSVYDVRELSGRPCVVSRDGLTVKFVRLLPAVKK